METWAELFVEEGLVQLGGCKVHQRQRDSSVRRRRADTGKSLILLVGRGEDNEQGGDMAHLSVSCVPKHPVLLSVFDELGGKDVSSVRQGEALDEKEAAPHGGDHAAGEKVGSPAEYASIGPCAMEITSLLVTEVSSILDCSCTPDPSSKACPLDSGVFEGCAHCAATEAIDERERHRNLAFDSWRGD